jgi:hypothetical protein
MPKISKERLAFQRSVGILPRAHLTPLESQKLYYESETKGTYIEKQTVLSDSFNSVHKIENHVRMNLTDKHAPFWSRSMCAYEQSYQPLPLEGAAINTELAKTFRPYNAAAVLRVPLKGETAYQDEFKAPTKDGRQKIMRPEISKHVRDDDHLSIVDSINHTAYPSYGRVSKVTPIKSDIVKPTKANAGLKFEGLTRYNEEYDGLAAKLMQESGGVEKVSYEDNSSRVWGNSIPNKMRNFLFKHEAFEKDGLRTDLPTLTSVLLEEKEPETPRSSVGYHKKQ